MKPMTERDEKGHLTHVRLSDGTEFWHDAPENLTHTRFGDGTERWYDAGHITHERLIDGTERWYDADGRVTKWKDKNGMLHTN